MTNRYVITFLIVVPLFLQSMEQRHKEIYDCEKLTKEFAHLQDSKEEMDKTVVRLFKRKNIHKKHLYNQVASLICFGSNLDGTDRTNPLSQAISDDNVAMVTFLLQRNASVNQEICSPFRVRSVAMAKTLAPYIKIEKKNDWGNTVAHWSVEKDTLSPNLLDYYVQNSDIANATNQYNDLPLHTLARYCSTYNFDGGQHEVNKKASTLIKRTSNINKFDNDGYTPLDIALNERNACYRYRSGYRYIKYPRSDFDKVHNNIFQEGEDKARNCYDACNELAELLKQHGGKSTNDM